MTKILLIILCISTLSCSSKRTDEYPLDNRLDFEKRGITSDTCSFCAIDSFLVATVDRDAETKIIFDYPVAIELLDRVALVHKYDNDAGYDTLMKIFKMKRWGDRNEIYRLTDQYGYYSQGIKPVLLDNSVTIVDTIKNERYVTFKDKDKNYIVDLSSYRLDDGVLMFKPGKSPIYWTMKKDEENCFAYFGFPTWYYNCR